jgi:hypothetical protein
VASGVVSAPPQQRRRRSKPGIVLLVISLTLFGLAIFHIVHMVAKGYTYACIGQGCPYQTPEVAGDLTWVSATIPFAILTLVGAILLFSFHGSGGTVGPTSWDQIPMTGGFGFPGTSGVSSFPSPPDPGPTGSRLRAGEVGAQAVVAGMHDMGMPVGSKRLYELDLAVTVPGKPPYHVKRTAYVPLDAVGRLYSGGTVPARVDPNDPNLVTLDLDGSSI